MICLILLLLFAAPVLGAGYSVEDLKKEYLEIFQVEVLEHDGRKMVGHKIGQLPEDHLLSSFVKENYWLLHYLQLNAARIDGKAEAALTGEPDTLSHFYHSSLMNDEEFNAHVLPLVSNYLASRGMKLSGYVPHDKNVLTLDDLIRVAVRFFYPNGVAKDGRIHWQICVGINGLKDFETERNLTVEAFCYDTIFTTLNSPQRPILDQFKEMIEEVKGLQLSTDDETKIARAQGAVWILLSKNETLKEMLLSAYSRKKDILSFVIEKVVSGQI